MSKTLLLVCTYNEGENLPRLLPALRQHSDADVLVIDDGSRDGTAEVLDAAAQADPSIRWVNRGGKLGLGTAIRDGLVAAVAGGYDYCLNLDADLSHDPADVPRLLAAGQSADLVIGSRFVAGGGMRNCSWKRRINSRCVNLLARTLIGWPYRDCSSAFRCYRTSRLAEIDLAAMHNPSYGFLEEILFEFYIRGWTVREEPIVYTERDAGESKISLGEATATARTLWRCRRRVPPP